MVKTRGILVAFEVTERGEESLAFRATIVAIEEDEITFVVSDDDVDAFGEERSREILSEELATRLND